MVTGVESEHLITGPDAVLFFCKTTRYPVSLDSSRWGVGFDPPGGGVGEQRPVSNASHGEGADLAMQVIALASCRRESEGVVSDKRPNHGAAGLNTGIRLWSLACISSMCLQNLSNINC